MSFIKWLVRWFCGFKKVREDGSGQEIARGCAAAGLDDLRVTGGAAENPAASEAAKANKLPTSPAKIRWRGYPESGPAICRDNKM